LGRSFNGIRASLSLTATGPTQSWGTFLHNHAPHIAAMDLVVVPTIGFIPLYVLVIVRLARRELVWINVTAHPTAEWIAQQLTEAFPWHEVLRYLIRDRDGIYGAAVTRDPDPVTLRGRRYSGGAFGITPAPQPMPRPRLQDRNCR
jgi:hypothetical protein